MLTDTEPQAAARARVAQAITATTTAWSKGASLAEIRAGFEALLAGPQPARAEPVTIAGMTGTLSRPAQAAGGAIILFCHGGGFQIGSVRSHASLMSRLAAASGVPVLGFDYRLAPEHRFPAAAEDCFSAYRALLARGHDARQIILAGDSAGGSLALGIALQARDQGLPLPAGIVLISPWLDLKLRGESYLTRAGLDIFSKPDQLRTMARTYLGRSGDPAHPLATPLDAPLGGLPPLLIHTGDCDITLDDSALLASRAGAAGVASTLKVWPEMYHHFQVFAKLPEAQQSLDEIGGFIRSRLAGVI